MHQKTASGNAAQAPGITYLATVQIKIQGARGLNDAVVKARGLLRQHGLQGRVLRVD